MSKLILCSEHELDELMRMPGIKNANTWIYSIDMERKIDQRYITEELYYKLPPYPRTMELVRKYGDHVIDFQLTSISTGNISNYIRTLSENQGMTYDNKSIKRLSDMVARSFTTGNSTNLQYAYVSMLYEIIEDDRTAIFVINRNSLDDNLNRQQFLATKKVFEKNQICPQTLYTKEDYMNYGEGINFEIKEPMKRRLIQFLVDNHTSRNAGGQDLEYACFPTCMIPSDINVMSVNDSRHYLKILGFETKDPIGGSKSKVESVTKDTHDERVYNTKLLSNYVMKTWYNKLKELDIRSMSLVEMQLWLIRLGIKFSKELPKKQIRELLEDVMSGFEKYVQGRCRTALEEMTNVDLAEKIYKEGLENITSPYDDRDRCIEEILIAYGEIDDNFVLPEKEYLKAMTKSELWTIYKDYYLSSKSEKEISQEQQRGRGIFKQYSKDTIIKFMQECESDRQEKKLVRDLYRDDLLNKDKEELLELFKSKTPNKNIINNVKEILKSSDSINIVVDRLCTNFGLKYKFEKLGKDIKTLEELESMSKTELVEYGHLQYDLILNTTLKKKVIIKYIMKAQDKYKKGIDKLNERSEFTRENLMKLSKRELIRIGSSSIFRMRMTASLSKEKMINKLMKKYYADISLSGDLEEPEKKEERTKLEIYLKERNKKFMKNNSLGMIMFDEFDFEKGVEPLQLENEMPDYIDQEAKEMEKSNIADILNQTRKTLKELEDTNERLKEINKRFGINNASEPEVQEKQEDVEEEKVVKQEEPKPQEVKPQPQNNNNNDERPNTDNDRRNKNAMKGFGIYLINSDYTIADEIRTANERENKRNKRHNNNNNNNNNNGGRNNHNHNNNNRNNQRQDNNGERRNNITERLRKIYS